MSQQLPPRRWAGWYVDPVDPTRIQYWDGARWTGRRRQRPMWTLGGDEGLLAARRVTGTGMQANEHLAVDEDPSLNEGPAHLPELSARTATTPTWGLLAEATGSGAGMAGNRRRRSPLPGVAAGWPPPWTPGSPRLLRHRRWASRWVAVVALVAVGVLAVLGAKAFSPAGGSGQLISDVNWLQAADTVCSSSLPAIRSAARRPSIDNRRQSNAQLVLMANDLDAVATHLGRLWAMPSDQASIKAWLGNWRSFDAWQRRYAKALGPPGNTRLAATALDRATQARQQANQFALANDLQSCLI